MQRDPASTSLPFGELTIDEVFFSYEIPRLFSSSGDGVRILAICVDEDDTSDTATFLYLQVSEDAYQGYRQGKLALRGWLDENAPSAWVMTWQFDGPDVVATGAPHDYGDLPVAWLPEHGAMLNHLRPTQNVDRRDEPTPENESQQASLELFDKLPVSFRKYLRTTGVTSETARNKERFIADYLEFHDATTVEEYQEQIAALRNDDYALAARQENDRNDVNHHVVHTWLRRGELTPAFQAASRFTFDDEELRAAIPELRARSAEPDDNLLRDFRNILNSVGVGYIVLRPPEGMPLHGVTRWIDRRVPVIQQTGRRLTDGFIITTLFHEIGHILNDPRGEMHLEYKTAQQRNTAAEKNARKFAREVLFGDVGVEAFQALRRDSEIRAKAREIGIAPGVALCEMHRRRWLPHNHGRKLFVDLPIDED